MSFAAASCVQRRELTVWREGGRRWERLRGEGEGEGEGKGEGESAGASEGASEGEGEGEGRNGTEAGERAVGRVCRGG